MKKLFLIISCVFISSCSTTQLPVRNIASEACEFEGQPLEEGDYILSKNERTGLLNEYTVKFIRCEGDQKFGSYLTGSINIKQDQVAGVTKDKTIAEYCYEKNSEKRIGKLSKLVLMKSASAKDLAACNKQGLAGCEVQRVYIKSPTRSAEELAERYQYCNGMSGYIGACLQLASEPEYLNVERVTGYKLKTDKIDKFLAEHPESCDQQKFCEKVGGSQAKIEKMVFSCE